MVLDDGGDDKVAFYLPSGDPVSFCAHAAMGAAAEIARVEGRHHQRGSREEGSATLDAARPVRFETVDGEKVAASVHDGRDGGDNYVVALDVKDAQFEVEPVGHPPTLYRILRDAFGLRPADLTKGGGNPATFVNANVFGRPKTLVEVKSLETLHSIKPPSSPEAFRTVCDALNSTGIYIYTKSGEGDDGGSNCSIWECRQFPRFSGYPEDPATGVAAAALGIAIHPFCSVASLKPISEYQFLQGTAMQRPSLIVLQNINLQMENPDDYGGGDSNNDNDENNNLGMKGKASFQLLGRVEVDRRDTVQADGANDGQ